MTGQPATTLRPFAFFTTLWLFAPTISLAEDESGTGLHGEIRQLTERAMKDHDVPGIAVAVIRDGGIAWIDGFGVARVGAKTPITENTVFNVGSVSKCVAAWGFMRLVESNEVELDQPIETYLNTWRFPDSEYDSRQISLRRLLSHTAGLSLHGYPGFTDAHELPGLAASLAGESNGAGDVRIIHPPGLKRLYSGGGYTVAQLMVEDQTKMRFQDYMDRYVLTPLEMDSTSFGWTNSQSAATPHDEQGKPISPVRFTALAAAGLETTCRDLAKFAVASMPDKSDSSVLLKRSTIRMMQQPVVVGEGDRSSGLGYQQMSMAGLTTIGHLGSNQGWEAALFLRPESGDGLVMLSNGSNGDRAMRPIYAAWARSLSAVP